MIILKTIQKKDAGFTFIETIVTISIILILSGVIGFSAIRYVDSARIAATRNQIETFRLALQAYFIDTGQFPTEAQGLQALWERPTIPPIPANWAGPYVDRQIPRDPWGNEFVYRNPGDRDLPFSIMSFGASGRPGGEGRNANIYSWQ